LLNIQEWHRVFQWLEKRPDWILEHWRTSAVGVIVGALLIWSWILRFQRDRIDLKRARRQERTEHYEEYLHDLDLRMEALEQKIAKKYKVKNAVFNEQFYYRRMKTDDRDAIREVLRRRQRSPQVSNRTENTIERFRIS